MQKLFRSLIAVGGLVGLAACGDDVSVTEPPPPPLSISGAPVTAVQVGAKVQLSASEAATWASSAANVASVDATGLVTAAAAGTASITATATADVNRKASVTITVVAPAVRNVTVSPAAVTMNPGGTQGFVANVDADPGVARTVTWTSTNTAVVTVNATSGVASAVAPGAATIIAASTAAPSVTGAASVTVRTPTQASVNIDRVTVGNTLTPVNFLAVVGQIDVTVNVDPGDFVLKTVELQIDGVTCPGCTQTFSAEQSASLSAAAVYGDSIAGAVSQILFSVQTSLFDAAGKPSWTNKQHAVSAKATLTNNNQTSTATSNRDMTFANVNTWVAAMTFTGTTASATGTAGNSAGLAYRRGGLTVTATPVIYNEGQSIVAAGGIMTFGSGCDAFVGTGSGQRNVSITGTGPFTGVFPQTRPGSSTSTRVNSVENYEFSAGLCGGSAGETPGLVAVDNSGNNIFSGQPPCIPASAPGGPFPALQFCPPSSVTAVRLDNNPPGSPFFGANPNGRQNGWINDAVGLNGANTGSSSTANNWIINGTADNGIGGGSTSGSAYQRFLRFGDPGPTGIIDAARAATASDAATLPAPSAANNSICAIVTARDQLGNESTRGSDGDTCNNPPFAGNGASTGNINIRFGVDIDEPTIDYAASSIPANARQNGATFGADAVDALNPLTPAVCTPNCDFVVTVADAGVIGVSGMLAGTPVSATVIRREADGTNFLTHPNTLSDCVIGVLTSSGSVCSRSTLLNNPAATQGLAVGLPLVNTLLGQVVPGPQTIDGFYTGNFRATDAAGNFIDIAATRVVVHDDTPPALTNALFNVPLASATAVFNANANDNLDLWFARYQLAYAGSGLPAPIQFPDVQINTFNATTLMNSNVAAGITVNGFIKQIELVTVNGANSAPPPVMATGGTFKPSGLTGNVFDQGNNASVTAATPIPGASVTNGIGFTTAAAAQCPGALPATVGCLTRSWSISAPAVVSVSANNTTACGPVTPATATSVTLTADASGPTATYNAPFTRVDFYVFNPVSGFLEQIGTGQQQPIFDDGSIFGRRHRWTFVWTPGNTYGCAFANINVYAFGVSAAGDGLVTPVFTNVSIVP